MCTLNCLFHFLTQSAKVTLSLANWQHPSGPKGWASPKATYLKQRIQFSLSIPAVSSLCFILMLFPPSLQHTGSEGGKLDFSNFTKDEIWRKRDKDWLSSGQISNFTLKYFYLNILYIAVLDISFLFSFSSVFHKVLIILITPAIKWRLIYKSKM